MESTNKEIINKVLSDTASKNEAKEVLDWFASSIEGQKCLSDMIDRDAYLLESEIEDLHPISSDHSSELYYKIINTINNRHNRRLLFSIAAVVFPLIFIIGIGLNLINRYDLFDKAEYKELYIPKGEVAHIFFQDGTEVFINADSRIRYPEKFRLKDRIVYLEGEAYFKVTSNKHYPFIVQAGNTKVNVLGTSFNVNAYDDTEFISVVLDDGKVVFDTPVNKYGLHPGQHLVYNKESGKTSIQNLSKSTNYSLWKDRILYLNDTSLRDVVRLLERRYDVEFIVKDANALLYTYTLITRQETVEGVLNELQKISPVNFSIHDKQIIVSL
ncbi:MAG: FecR domain-containing protein [Dysgonamonadaceae bacterium]